MTDAERIALAAQRCLETIRERNVRSSSNIVDLFEGAQAGKSAMVRVVMENERKEST
jgi:hypothetical protein